MATKKRLKKELTPTVDLELDLDFVGVSVFTDDNGYPEHAAIFISKGEESHIFHFDSENLKENKINECDQFLTKVLQSIQPFEVGAFLVQCKEALNNPAPGYHFFIDGSYINGQGKYVSELGIPVYRMTCVGFCLALLKGWFEEDYLMYEDWRADNTINPATLQQQLSELMALYPNFSEEELSRNIRRIKPIEYIASGYFNKRPIRKANTDTIIVNLKDIVKEWHDKTFVDETTPSSI